MRFRNSTSSYTRKSSSGKKIFIMLLVLIIFIGFGLFLSRNTAGFSSFIARGFISQDILVDKAKRIGAYVGTEHIRDYVSRLWEEPMTDDRTKKAERTDIIGKVAIVADSHSDTVVFSRVIEAIQREQVDVLIHLGDVSSGGEIDELLGIKALLDESRLPYYVVPGDHDYNWLPEYDLRNFYQIFAMDPSSGGNLSFKFHDKSFILYNNSRKSNEHVDWLIRSLENASSGEDIFLFTASPFMSPYFESKTDNFGDEVLEKIQSYPIRQVFSGDTHIFSRYTEEQTGITTTTVGASGSYKNPLPQYVLVEFFDNGDFEIKAKPAVELESYE